MPCHPGVVTTRQTDVKEKILDTISEVIFKLYLFPLHVSKRYGTKVANPIAEDDIIGDAEQIQVTVSWICEE